MKFKSFFRLKNPFKYFMIVLLKKGEKYIILINLSKISEFQIAKKI